MSVKDAQKQADSAVCRVILVDASELDRALRRDERIELIRVRDVFEALGELSVADTAGVERLCLVLGPGASSGADLRELRESAVEIHGETEIYVLRDVTNPRTEDGVRVVNFSHLPGALFEASEDESAITEAAPPEKASKPEKAGKKKKKDKRKGKAKPGRGGAAGAPNPIGPASLGDERTILRSILSGGDPTHEIITRVADTLGNDHIEFVRAIDHEEPPEINGGYVAQKVARRGHTFGWLVGPAKIETLLAEQADSVALWLCLADQHAQLRSLAFTDSLTGAWNRRYFDKYLASALNEARQKRHSLTLMVFDIDDFKIYNDDYGHAAGDEILIETIRLLKSHVRPNDRVCRIGGDEFAVIFYDPAGPRDPSSHHPRSIFQIARRFQKQIANHNFPKLAERAKGNLTISGGLATFPWDAYDAEGLLERADHLALVSKNQGKNVLTIGESAYSPESEVGNEIDLPAPDGE